MNSAWLFYLYGGILIAVFTVGMAFYVVEYRRRGGELIATIAGFLKVACLFPMALLPFLVPGQSEWPHRLFWRAYAVLVVWYLASMLFSRRFAPMRRNLLEKIGDAPVVAAVLILPAFGILCQYALGK